MYLQDYLEKNKIPGNKEPSVSKEMLDSGRKKAKHNQRKELNTK
ncbi:hypothetical protein [Gilliamella sp. ESL0254]|nr:hypothetical protein [Gilliamella sp. ESL0254]